MKTQPFILALETSGRDGSVALADGPKLLDQLEFSAPMRHSAEIFTSITALCKRFNRNPKQIQHVYLSIGPGSFTGLRIAVTIAKIFHLANNAKIVAVNTMDVIAANTADCVKENNPAPQNIAAILDAKRGQFFVAAYKKQKDLWNKSLPDCLMTAPQFLEKFTPSDPDIWLLGEGLLYYKDKFKAESVKFFDQKYWTPTAKKVHTLGLQMALEDRFADPTTLRPNYLRTPDVKQKSKN